MAEPEGVAISPQGDLIAVGNEEEGTVSKIPIVNGAVPSFGERLNFEPSGKEAEIAGVGAELPEMVTEEAEKAISYLPEWTDADDDFEGRLDSEVISGED